jgi:signal transduction histidine kinase
MAALNVPALFHWDVVYVLASLAIGVSLGATALTLFARGETLRLRLTATTLMTLAIAGLHFTAMTALTLELDPLAPANDSLGMAPEWLAVAIAAVMMIIIVFGLSGSAVDQHLARRSVKEAERLRAYVAELEATKSALEDSTRSLRGALEAAAAASQAKSQFLATMSHELRTPLNAIIGFSEMISGELFGPHRDPRYKEFATDVVDSGRLLLNLINDVLDLSKIDAGRLEVRDDEVDAAAVVRGTLRMIAPQAETAGVVLGEEIAAALPRLRADQRRVRQILLNLLSNAVKFTPQGGRVRAEVFCAEQGLAIAIADSGIGMAAEDIPRALERFGQIDSSLSRKYEGTGLGLPLAKRLMEIHGGTLEIESAPGAGTTVTVMFPAVRLIEQAAAA